MKEFLIFQTHKGHRSDHISGVDEFLDFNHSIDRGRIGSGIVHGQGLIYRQIFPSEFALVSILCSTVLHLMIHCYCSQFMADILTMGAPVYWVLGNGITFDDQAQQNLICGGPGCNNDSVVTKLYIASNFPDV